MQRGDPVNSFPAALLSESYLPQDGRQDHPRTIKPGQGLVQADGPASLGAGYLGRPDSKVSGREIQSHRRHTQSSMQVTPGGAGLLSTGGRGSDERGGERSNRYQTEPLMDLEHVRPSVKECGTVSLPFPAGKHKCVTVKVIDPRGNEVMQVHKL